MIRTRILLELSQARGPTPINSHSHKHTNTQFQGTETGDKAMCNGVACPEGEMCMRGSNGMYCMKM